MEQLKLLEVEENYSLVGLKESCILFVKRKYPKPAEDESLEEYNEFLRDEIELEIAYRLRKIADQIEGRILNPMKKDIREVYKDLTTDVKKDIMK